MGWKTTSIVVGAIITGVLAGVYFGFGSQRPAVASISSAAVGPASNSVSDEDRQFMGGFRTAKISRSGKDNLQGIGPLQVAVSIEGVSPQYKDTFIRTVQLDVESRLRQAGIQVADANAGTDAGVLGVYVGVVWTTDRQFCSWDTELGVSEWTHAVRRGQHYMVPSTIWSKSSVSHARSKYTDGFTARSLSENSSPKSTSPCH